jgi:hypothetical protein
MGPNTMAGGELDAVAVLHVEELQLADLTRGGHRRDGFIAPDEHRGAVGRRHRQLCLEEPRLVLVQLRRRLLVQEEQGDEPAAGFHSSSAASHDHIGLLRVDLQGTKHALRQSEWGSSTGRMASPDRARPTVALALGPLFRISAPGRGDDQLIGTGSHHTREPER